MKQIELYDVGRCTHKAVPGMYEFIVANADSFVPDTALAKEIQNHAANREKPGYSIPQKHFSQMCDIWVRAYQSGDFPIDVAALTFPDTIDRFRYVKSQGREIGILTSGSEEFTKILYGMKVGNNTTLAQFVDHYFLGEEIGDKDKPETFANLWDATQGRIAAIFDDKVSVCQAAVEGLERRRDNQARDAKDMVSIYLLDRKGKYANATGDLADKINDLQEKRVRIMPDFNAVTDFELGGDE